MSCIVQFILCALRMPSSFANPGLVYIYGFGNCKSSVAVTESRQKFTNKKILYQQLFSNILIFSERATISCSFLHNLAENSIQWDVTEENIMHVVYVNSPFSRWRIFTCLLCSSNKNIMNTTQRGHVSIPYGLHSTFQTLWPCPCVTGSVLITKSRLIFVLWLVLVYSD